MKTKLLFLLPFILFGGLISGQKKADIKRQKLYTTKKGDSIQPTLFGAQYDASRRGTMLFVDKNQRIRMLSENPLDAAIQSITEITAKFKGLNGDIGEAEAAFKAQKSIAELGKRTAAVNLLRDALYRLNELHYAMVDEKKEIIEWSKRNDLNKIVELNRLQSQNLLQQSISDNDLKHLFTKVIDNVKDIAVQEAKTDEFKYQADKTENEALSEKYKAEAKKYETLLSIIQKGDGKLTKDEMEKYLKEILEKNKG